MSDFATEHRAQILRNEFGTREKFQNLAADILVANLRDMVKTICQDLGDVPANNDWDMPEDEDFKQVIYLLNNARFKLEDKFPKRSSWRE